MTDRRALAIVGLLCLSLVVWGCEGDPGPQGPPGPPGPVGAEFSYIGGMGEECLHCHATIVATWTLTGHMEGTSDLDVADQANPYCMQCHTTGWDSPLAFGQTLADVTRGPNDEGYDDYFEVAGADAADRRAALAGVQCEGCHGPMGPGFNSHKPEVSFATHFVGGETLSLCAPCHDTQIEEWVESGHAFYDDATGMNGTIEDFNGEHYINNSSCDYCHTSEGYIRNNDPAYADYEFPEEQSFIGCPTCHDPHAGEAGGGNLAQLRNITPVEVAYHPGLEDGDIGVPRMEGKGAGQTCAQCHRARRSTSNVEGQIASGYAHFGPHGSPQMDMYIGNGSYEIPGYTYDRDSVHKLGIADACVSCHMAVTTSSPQHRMHNFNPSVAEGCGQTGCHPGLTDFNYNNVQTDVAGLLDTAAQALGFTDLADFEANFDNQDPLVAVWEREVAYAIVFVVNDGSMGVHNSSYAESLLNNAIAYAGTQVP